MAIATFLGSNKNKLTDTKRGLNLNRHCNFFEQDQYEILLDVDLTVEGDGHFLDKIVGIARFVVLIIESVDPSLTIALAHGKGAWSKSQNSDRNYDLWAIVFRH